MNQRTMQPPIGDKVSEKSGYKNVGSCSAKWCECGNPKLEDDYACPHCIKCDGATIVEYSMVSALRTLGGVATSDSLNLEMGLSWRQMLRSAKKAIQCNHVTRYEEPTYIEDNREASNRRRMGTMKTRPVWVLK